MLRRRLPPCAIRWWILAHAPGVTVPAGFDPATPMLIAS